MGNAGITSYDLHWSNLGTFLRFSPGSDFVSCLARSGAAGVIRTLRKHLKEAVLSSDILPPNVIPIMKSMSPHVTFRGSRTNIIEYLVTYHVLVYCFLFYVCGNEHQPICLRTITHLTFDPPSHLLIQYKQSGALAMLRCAFVYISRLR